MEYQKTTNLLDNTPNEPFKFRTKNWVEVNDNSHGTYCADSQIKFKTSMLRSSLYYYSDLNIYIFFYLSDDCISVELRILNN